MSIPDLRRRIAPAEVLAWFRFDDALCAAIRAASIVPETLAITVRGEPGRTRSAASAIARPRSLKTTSIVSSIRLPRERPVTTHTT